MNPTRFEYETMLARVGANTRKGEPEDAKAAHDAQARREYELQCQIIAEVERRGWIAIRSIWGRPTTILPNGCPDFLVIADGGRVFLVEAKAKGGKMEKGQLIFRAVAKKLGHTVHEVRSLLEFMEIICWPKCVYLEAAK